MRSKSATRWGWNRLPAKPHPGVKGPEVGYLVMEGTQRRFLAGPPNAFTSGRLADGQMQVIPLMDGLPRTGTRLPDHLDAVEAVLEMYNANLLPVGPQTTWRLLFLLHVLAKVVDPERRTRSPKIPTAHGGPAQ